MLGQIHLRTPRVYFLHRVNKTNTESLYYVYIIGIVQTNKGDT